MSKRTAIIIIGMHRSGTSALTGSLNKAGISIGMNTIEPSFDNEKGFFENLAILHFNSSILKKINTNWQIPFFNKNALGEKLCTENYINELKDIINEQFEGEQIILIKDPRISLLANVYIKAFEELDIDYKFIIQQRKVSSIINSLVSRNDFNENKGAILWLSYYLNAEYFSRGQERIFVDYESLLKNKSSEIKSILSKLNIELQVNDSQLSEIDTFLDIDLDHSVDAKNTHNKTKFNSEINKVTESFKKLNEKKKSYLSIYKGLDKIYYGFEELSSAFYDNLVYNNNINLSYQLLNDKNEILLSNKLAIETDLISFEINIEDPAVSAIKVYPSNQFCHFSINAVRVNDVLIHESNLLSLDHGKKIIEHGKQFIVENLDYVFYKRLDIETPITVNIDLQYHSFGLNTLKNVRFISNVINDWFYAKLDTEYKEKEDAVFQLEKLKKSRAINKEENENTILNLNNSIDSLQNTNKAQLEKLNLLEEKLLLKETIEKQNTIPAQELQNKLNVLEDNKVNQLLSIKEYEVKLHFIEKELNEKKNWIRNNESNLSQEKEKQELLLSDIKAAKGQLEMNKKEIKKLNDSLLKEQKAKSALNKQNKKLQKEFSTLKEKRIHLTKDLKQKLSKIEKLNTLLSENNLLFENYENEVSKYKEEIKTLKDKHVYLSNVYEELNHNEIEVNKENKKLEKKLKAKENRINELENENTSLKDEVFNLKSEISVLNELITNYHTKVSRLQNLKRELLSEIEAIKSSISYRIGFGATWPARKIYDVTNRKAENQKKLNLLLASLASRQENPSLFLKTLSSENIKSLSKALSTEDPKTIVQNLDKYLGKKVNTNGILPSEEVLQIDNQETPSSTDEFAPSMPDSEIERPKILYISPNLPDFDTSSGGKRATRMIALMAEEFDVYVFTLGAKQQKYIDKLESVGAYVVKGFSFNELRKRIKHFQSIIFSFYYTYYDYNRFISLYPDAKIIIDSVDVHWVREERSLGIWDQLTPEIVATNKTREINAYKNADFIWAVTDNDKTFIQNEVPKVAVKVVSNVHSPILTEYKDNGNNNMLFIGGYNHYPNISAVKLVAEKILPIINKEIKDARLIIAGANAPDDVIALKKLPNVEFKGFIKEEEMDALYDRTFISVCPVLAGAGIKGKVCEAISYMTPVATNTIGNEGVNLINMESGIINDNFDEMANDIITFMKRGVDLSSVAKKAQSNLYNLVGPDIVKRRMLSSILPEVSICIVTWNRIDLLKRCIESIEGNTRYPNYKILVHSNGCEDGTQSYLEAAAEVNKKIVPILSKENEVFVIPNNNMAAMFPENDVILLNNDTYVTEGWLYALFDAAYSSTDIGLSGSKILYPDGRLQEFGSELYEDGTGRNIGKFDDPNKDEYKKIKRVGYVSGCSLYVKRSTIEKVGLFDLQFHPCYCEDSDLCYTAWENDLQTVVTPHSIIYHDEGGTSGTDEEKGFKAYQKVNFKKFLDKHRVNLKSIQQKIDSLN